MAPALGLPLCMQSLNPAAAPASQAAPAATANCASVQSPGKRKEKTRIDFGKVQLKLKPHASQKSWEYCLEIAQRAFLVGFLLLSKVYISAKTEGV